ARPVEPPRVVRTDDVGRVPVRTIGIGPSATGALPASPGAAAAAGSLPSLRRRLHGGAGLPLTRALLLRVRGLGRGVGAARDVGRARRAGDAGGAPLRTETALRRLRRHAAFIRDRYRHAARSDRARRAGPQIESRDVAVLRRRVDDVRILGIVARLEAGAAADDVPVARAHAPAVRARA